MPVAAAPTATSITPAASSQERRVAEPPAAGTLAGVSAVTASPDSTLANSPAVANRSAGTLAAALMMADSSAGGTVARTVRKGGIGSTA
jgi:hypothetical protein